SRALAERLWPAADAIGRRFRIDADQPWYVAVGIVGNVKNGGFKRPLGDLAVYHARSQVKRTWRIWSLTVRAAGNPSRLERPLREIVRALNPGVPVVEVETADDAIAGANARVRFATFL